jgi:hypothetical protein
MPEKVPGSVPTVAIESFAHLKSVFCGKPRSVNKVFLFTDWIQCNLPAADLAAITSLPVEKDPTPAPSPCQKAWRRAEGGTNLLDKMNER